MTIIWITQKTFQLQFIGISPMPQQNLGAEHISAMRSDDHLTSNEVTVNEVISGCSLDLAYKKTRFFPTKGFFHPIFAAWPP